MAKSWNPWHGCRKYSSGCLHCYVHRSDIKYDKDPEAIYKTKNFSLPILKKKTVLTVFLQENWFGHALPRISFWKMPTLGGKMLGIS